MLPNKLEISLKMNNIVAAVVVTYNRKDLLLECLDGLLVQTLAVNKIIVIDNASTDGTKELLHERGYLENPLIEYVQLIENTGGSGGFYEGVKRGYEAGYDWLWLMDDDSEPAPDALELMAEHFNENNLVALANLKVGEDGIPQYHHTGWFSICSLGNRVVDPVIQTSLEENLLEIDFSSFVGILVRASAISLVGMPKKEFFIHHDDVEYCLRLIQHGRILLVPDSKIIHKDQRNKRITARRVLGRESVRIASDSLWIYYYGARNLAWIKSRRCPLYLLGAAVLLARQTVGIMIYDDFKMARFKIITHAIINGIFGRFDNEFPLKYKGLGKLNQEKILHRH